MSKIYKCDICNVNYPPLKGSGLVIKSIVD